VEDEVDCGADEEGGTDEDVAANVEYEYGDESVPQKRLGELKQDDQGLEYEDEQVFEKEPTLWRTSSPRELRRTCSKFRKRIMMGLKPENARMQTMGSTSMTVKMAVDNVKRKSDTDNAEQSDHD